MIGLGLLEAVYDSDIESLADPDDADGDGISGRPNRVWDDGRQALALGRFGWKAGQPSVLQQSVHAINGDIGISTPGMPSAAGDCTPRQPACLAAPDGNSALHDRLEASRSEERRAGQEWVRTCSCGVSQYHSKKNNNDNI